MKKPRTRIEFLHDGRWQWWSMFGAPAETVRLSPSVHVEYHDPKSLVGVSRQWRNEFGVTHWETLILETLDPEEEDPVVGQRIPHVRPGALVLLHTYGTERAKTVQTYIRTIRDYGLSPSAVPELHRQCAPYLRLGTFPRRQLKSFFDEHGCDSADASGPLLPTPPEGQTSPRPT